MQEIERDLLSVKSFNLRVSEDARPIK